MGDILERNGRPMKVYRLHGAVKRMILKKFLYLHVKREVFFISFVCSLVSID